MLAVAKGLADTMVTPRAIITSTTTPPNTCMPKTGTAVTSVSSFAAGDMY